MIRRPFPLLLFLLSLGLYAWTLAPTVVTIFDDSLEMQLALPTFAILHPTGYPLYSLLGGAFTRLLPVGDAALRANLLSALFAAGGVGLLFSSARRLGSARIPAATSALLLAVAPVWWSQATIAEVYSLQGLLTLGMIYAALRWEKTRAQRCLIGLGLAVGVGLAHHRMTLLILPGLALFLLWADPGLLRRPRHWRMPLIALLAPLLLYAWLPLRGAAGSLDGGYAQMGFWRWVLGGGYSTFLRDNPFGIERGLGDILASVIGQFGWPALAVAAAGALRWRQQPRRLIFLLLVLLVDLLFAARYRVADIEVFLLPAILVAPLFIAVGLTALWQRVLAAAGRRRQPLAVGLALILLLWPAILAGQRLPDQDRARPPARGWGVHDYGRDLLAHAAPDSVVVGILGEMTLLRYFQRTAGLREDVVTIAADGEAERLAAIAAHMAAGRAVYTTRPLAGLPDQYSLAAAGPLIRVHPPAGAPAPALAHAIHHPFTPQVTLAGWQGTLRQPRSGPSLRVSLAWQVAAPPPADFKISARLLAADGALLAQTDDFPVHNTYPPSRWRGGEVVIDGYDLPLAAVPAGPVSLLILLYAPADGREIGRWQGEMGQMY